MNEKIEHITYPWVYTDKGQRYHAKQLSGEPKIGYQIDSNLNVLNNGSVDVDCPGGKCPIK
jgi:hypothetical protein